MVHGPCGLLNPAAICMDRNLGLCTKNYPKDFTKETFLNETGGYPVYRRRNDGRTVSKVIQDHTYHIDNRWIVPHNLYLSTKYDAHINVELCSSIKSIKYVYKYVYKGHDRASMSVEQNDEIRSFIDARYVSAPEACWRLFSFPLHKEFPSHQRLAIHLQNQNPVYFNESDDIADVLNRASDQETTLTAWFKINENDDESARSILYPNFPEEYVWHSNKRQRKWQKRQRGFGATIGRIYAISPKQSELFHLRMLLYHIVAGATSFEDMRTVNGVVYPTYQAAARALGLLASDNEWHNCLEEAALTQSAISLHKLFCIILSFCAPSNPYELWQTFKISLSEDYAYQLANDSTFDAVVNNLQEIACNNAMLDINDILAGQHGSSLTRFPEFVLPIVEDPNLSRIVREQLRLNALARDNAASFDIEAFNSDQRRVYDTIMHCIERDGCQSTNFARVFFVDGPGGTGKTFLFNAILNAATRSGEDGFALAVASSGTAALLLEAGRTAHSTFKIPLQTSSVTMCGIKPHSEQADLLRKTKIIIWDESSMISKSTLETVDRTFKDIFSEHDDALKSVPSGGRLMVFGGDFRQVLPVVPKGGRSDVVNQCINRSHLWQSFKIERLRINMRVQQAQTSNDLSLSMELHRFAHMLLDIGDGATETLKIVNDATNTAVDTDYIKVMDEMLIPGENLFDLISSVYPGFESASNIGNTMVNSAILTPTNANVSEINKLLMDSFPGESVTYYSADAASCNNQDQVIQFPPEYLNCIESGSLPSHSLTLKVGCPIMLLRNLDPSSGLCNGTRLVVKSLLRNIIEATIQTGPSIGSVVCIPRIELISPDSDSVQFRRRQFPVRTAFAMTINKAQGQTLDSIGLYLPKPVFSHGQLYVLSCTTLITYDEPQHLTN
ncbi:ATP-dependent helicase RRM3-like [Mucor ambiguus]|uniref:ATP-dependent DNA helicase n=1 Tax=Mucor ambiguus TaxID=91626 RepID=A0A0C9N9L6_9FUNG|nr:ATP-dependent helicase RRM3-like [Mucor ambiguus]